jgi:hypothetical protein
MLDSLVRVSRRVGRVANTDTADANTSNVARNFKAEPNRPAPASRYQTIGQLSIIETSVYADVFVTLALDTRFDPTKGTPKLVTSTRESTRPQ